MSSCAQTDGLPLAVELAAARVRTLSLAEIERHVYGSGPHFIRAGDIVLDCGASDGDFTREALQAGAGKVVAIEIAPTSAECIRRNLAAEVAKLKGEEGRCDEVFRKQVEAEKSHVQVLGKKFDELFKRVKENPDDTKPVRDIDL